MKLLIFLYGAIIGSFLNVCIYRIPRKESIAFPASHCPSCDTALKWFDNIPLISYLFLMGRCRYCREKISTQYPIVEFINGVLYVFLFTYFGWGLDFIFYALMSSVLIVITFIDLREMIIPDILVLIILGLSVLHKGLNYFIYNIDPNLSSSFIGLLIAGGLFLLIVILSSGGMGGGDVTLIGALGFVLGFKQILLTIFLSFILGAIISLFLLLFKIKGRKDPIPFGPFIVLGFFITLLWGSQLIQTYLSLIYI